LAPAASPIVSIDNLRPRTGLVDLMSV